MFENGRVLDHEAFSFTIPGEPWTNYYWLSQCALFGAWKAAGFAGVIALRAALVLLTAAATFAVMWRRTGRQALEATAFTLLVSVMLIVRAVNVRPHVVSYLFLALAVLLLDRWRSRPERVDPWLPLLAVAWASLHGVEYPVVLLLAGVTAAVELLPHRDGQMADLLRRREVARWPLLVLATALAFLANPFGARLFAAAGIAGDREVMAQIIEMRPQRLAEIANLAPDLDVLSLVPYHLLALAGLALVPLWLGRREWRALALYGAGLGLALSKVRFVPEFALLAGPEIAATVAGLGREAGGLGRAAPWLRRGVALVGVYHAVTLASSAVTRIRAGTLETVDATQYPVGAARWIEREGLEGNLLCNPSDGGYVDWALAPRVRISMDMRTPEPFGAQVMWLSRSVNDGVLPLERMTARWPVDLVLAARGSPLAARLRAGEAGYAPVWVDGGWILFVKDRLLGGERARARLRWLGFLERETGGSDGADRDHLDEIRAEAERLVDVDPGNAVAQAAILRTLLQQQRFSDAHDRAARLATAYPRTPVYRFYEGSSLEAAGAEGGRDPLREAIRLDPAFLPPYPVLATADLASGRDGEGLEVMEDYAKRKLWLLSGIEYTVLGHLRARVGHAKAAADAYERAIWQLPAGDPVRAQAEKGLASVRRLP